MHHLRYKLFWLGISVLLMLTARPASAQLDLVFGQNVYVQRPGDIFSVAATVTNPATNTDTYTLDSYFLTFTPVGDSPPIDAGNDAPEDPTGFFNTFARPYAPGESASGNFFDLALSNTAPAGVYDVNVSLRDISNTSLGQGTFQLNIQAIPEPGLSLSLGILLAAGGVGFWRQRRSRSNRI